MNQLLLVTLIIFIGVPFAVAQTNLEQEFKQLLQDRADGKRRDDKAFVERTTAETRISVNEKGDIRRAKSEHLFESSQNDCLQKYFCGFFLNLFDDT